MSLQQQALPPLVEKGWIRAILLLIIYTSLSLGGGQLLPSAELWFATSFVLSFVLVYLFRKYIDRRSFESLGLNPSHLFPDAVIGLATGVFLICIGALIIYLLHGVEWIDIMYNGQNLFLSLVLLIMISFSEELVFRGYVLRNLMKSINKWTALFISSALFTIVHYSNQGIPPIGLINTFLGGLVLGISFILTRGLWLPVFFHLSWNFVQGPILGFRVSGLAFDSVLTLEVSGNNLITGGLYGFEGSIICTILLTASFIAGCYLEQKKSYALIGS